MSREGKEMIALFRGLEGNPQGWKGGPLREAESLFFIVAGRTNTK